MDRRLNMAPAQHSSLLQLSDSVTTFQALWRPRHYRVSNADWRCVPFHGEQ